MVLEEARRGLKPFQRIDGDLVGLKQHDGEDDDDDDDDEEEDEDEKEVSQEKKRRKLDTSTASDVKESLGMCLASLGFVIIDCVYSFVCTVFYPPLMDTIVVAKQLLSGVASLASNTSTNQKFV